jgi:hypothetical protein
VMHFLAAAAVEGVVVPLAAAAIVDQLVGARLAWVSVDTTGQEHSRQWPAGIPPVRVYRNCNSLGTRCFLCSSSRCESFVTLICEQFCLPEICANDPVRSALANLLRFRIGFGGPLACAACVVRG